MADYVEYVAATSPGACTTLPAAGDGVSITPTGVAWTNTAWAQVAASVSSALDVVGLEFVPAAVSNFFDAFSGWEIDVGVGAPGSESVIATFSSVDVEYFQIDGTQNCYIPLSIPINAIPNASRVSVRLRKERTGTANWLVKVAVGKEGADGVVSRTTNPLLSYPAAATTPSTTDPASPNTNTAWVQLVASTADAIYLAGAGIHANGSGASQNYTEFDIGIGAPGSEVVVTTLRCWQDHSPSYFPLRPLLDAIPSGSRIAFRTRSNTTASAVNACKLSYYNKTGIGSVASLLTTKPMKWYPSASDNTNVPSSGTNWANPSWTQWSASLAADTAVVAIQYSTDVGTENELDFGVGAPGSEVVVATHHQAHFGNKGGTSVHHYPWPVSRFPASSRVALRARNDGSNSGGMYIAVGYYENLDASLKVTSASDAPASWPAAANMPTVTPSGTAWNNSAWAQLVAVTGANSDFIYEIPYISASAAEFEFDIGVGGAGSEVVIHTVPGWTHGTNEGIRSIYCLIPTQILPASRVAIRLRKADTSASAWSLGANYYGVNIAPPPPPPGPVPDCIADDTTLPYEDPCGIKTPLFSATLKIPLTFAVPNPTWDYLRVAEVPHRNPSTYYGGYFSPRIKSFQPIRRVASDFSTGAFQRQQSSMLLADKDHGLRKLIADHDGSLRFADLFFNLVSDTQRRALGQQRVLFQGKVLNDDLEQNLDVTVAFCDTIGVGYNAIGDELQLPQRLLKDDFGGAYGIADTQTPTLTLLGEPIIFGSNSDEGVPPPKGRIPVIYVGKRACADGVIRHIGYIAGHACKQLYNVYDETTPTPVALNWGVDAFGPGKTGWATVNGSAALYSVINNRWHTVIALNVGSTIGDNFASGSVRLWANVDGIEDIGDGTGTLITIIQKQYKHILLNFILNNWQSGPWLSSPVFETMPGGPTMCRVNTDSFNTAALIGQQYVTGGMKGAGVIGVRGQLQSVRQVIQKFNVQAYVTLGVNQFNQYFVVMLDRRRDVFLKPGARAIRDFRHTLQSAPFRAPMAVDQFADHFRGAATLNLRTGKYEALGEVENGVSVGRWGIQIPSAELYDFINDPATALALADERLRFRSKARRLPSWRESLCGLRNDLLDCVPMTEIGGEGASGYQNRAIWIQSIAVNQSGTVDFTAYDIDDLLVNDDSQATPSIQQVNRNGQTFFIGPFSGPTQPPT